jgi:hemerythrin-like domain-containing protein
METLPIRNTMDSVHNRRSFIRNGLKITALSGIAGTVFFESCGDGKEQEDQEVSPPEDLMQEHGVLNRVLLIYDTCKIRLQSREVFPIEELGKAAGIIKSFIEDYHEKQEENYLFPRFEKANQLIDLVKVLRLQHQAGRNVTDQIIQIVKTRIQAETEKRQLILSLSSFNSMYRPHEAREDTVLFPAFRKIVSRHEYDSLGEEFEKNEHKLFGEDGFEATVNKVADIEKRLGIYELAQFTPQK